MSTKDDNCGSMFPSRKQLSDTHLTLLVSAYSISSAVIFLTNVFAVYGLVKTKQFVTYSQKLLVILNICDSAVGILALPSMILTFTKFSHNPDCEYGYFAQFVGSFFVHLSACLIAIISMDRFLHMRWLNRYYLYMTSVKMTCSVAFAMLLSAFISVGKIIAAEYKFVFEFHVVVSLTEILCTMTIFIVYVLTLNAVREQVRDISNLSQSSTAFPRIDNKMALTVFLILTTTLICYIPVIVAELAYGYSVFIREQRPSALLSALILWFVLLTCLNSGFNAFILLSRNRPIKSSLWRKLCKEDEQHS